ncbi:MULTISPECIES: mannose-1-phosphate guanylyltransferase/mannose-6-phosphate isomerase [unclassified Ketobacter]|uniref:mannose-1-phosphate guanylyltransferase/mannose-6-phosphate isomerase n=1 Tax=unclassified Ketobacter TaxID=2639109 RepID=UPI000F161FD3|nr:MULTISPECIES: mannose-1-phosphate guanylyltransferase/mannose-6-phosphate isomerase [unclassified Ketobacter]MCK5793053.1 mannose-1-phosphate guanylyltransferase/mannose-6-phosphate isomerase [Ketobacter sp.]RLT88716.1 MAG: mannose-1-phosphate guanylyltransferase/mannose-6-phosphate isomerase [Ketobacter sp. GenoA1]RLT97683.1 MAG: mannose-1-phosphate guanylyltransferase/mannose-6-phosphate isomerase [Ketobacter sp.]
MIPVVLSGGSGSRLWPLSRSAYPKQFLPLCSGYSLVQDTVMRLAGSVATEAPIFVTANDQRFLLADQVQTLGAEGAEIVLEPARRNTAPAIALACFAAQERAPESVVLVLPSDHHIENKAAFQQVLELANTAAVKGNLVTFGVVPTKPETGYGYIKANNSSADGWLSIDAFVEKPSVELAEQYLESGDYYWNSGMFAFRADVYLQELKQHNPAIYDAAKASWDARSEDLDFIRVGEEAFVACPEDSIDYAVMEKTEKAVVIPLDSGWSDVGSWQSLWEVQDKDATGNVLVGDVIAQDTENTMVHASNRMVACLGVKDLVIVETTDAVLVADINQVQKVKDIVKLIEADGRSEHEFHREVHRPWGRFDSVDAGDRYQVKRITVKPGAKLSTQMHHHRAEHWVVVQGTAKVQRGEDSLMLTENQSVYIPLGEVHYLENPGKIPLEIIEIQTGSYLGEDDIIRFNDQYGRGTKD